MGLRQKRFLTSALIALLMTVPGNLIHGQSDAVQFIDITVPAGINFKHVSSPEKKYIAESMSGGVALFDYDNDGYLDIFLVNSLTVELLKSNKRTRSRRNRLLARRSVRGVRQKVRRRARRDRSRASTSRFRPAPRRRRCSMRSLLRTISIPRNSTSSTSTHRRSSAR